MAHNPWNIAPGLNNVGSYQSSGEPFVTGAINATDAAGTKVSFPQVTRWLQVYTYDAGQDLRLGFSANGIRGNAYDGYGGFNHILIPASGSTGPGSSGILELKVSEIWLFGSNDVHVIAGLTAIPSIRTYGTAGANWSGSSGVG